MFVAVFVVVAIFAPLLAPYPPNEQNLALLANGCCPGPSWAHPMGVDELGRDELSRVMYGARYSLVIGVVEDVYLESVRDPLTPVLYLVPPIERAGALREAAIRVTRRVQRHGYDDVDTVVR